MGNFDEEIKNRLGSMYYLVELLFIEVSFSMR